METGLIKLKIYEKFMINLELQMVKKLKTIFKTIYLKKNKG